MNEKLRIDLTVLLPKIGEGDRCIELLTERLNATRGVEQAHIVCENGTAALCLHYDPNLLPLSQVERIARDAGAALTEQYRHERLPVIGMNTADAAPILEGAIAALPGVQHASVNYPAATAFVAYDTQIVKRDAIERTIRSLGYTTAAATPVPAGAVGEAHEEHDHGSAPSFLPHWMQEQWTLILVALAAGFFLVGWVGQTFFGMSETVALSLYILTYVTAGYDVATHAIPGLLRGKFDTDVLMLAAATGAAILGEWAEGAFLLLLFAIGHAGEHYAMDRARNAINALGELMPRVAQVRRGTQVVETPVEEVVLDDVVVVRPGDRIPVDGTVASGESNVNQAPITGESMPVAKQTGDDVFAGTVNQDTALDVRVTRLARDNTLSRVMQMVADAQAQQSPTQQFTQRFTAWFVPAILVLVLVVIVVPPLVGWATWETSFYRGMLLLVAASPCALAIGTPAAVLSGIAQAARNGVLIKGGVHLENLGALDAIAFDKTGTITEGRFAVTDVLPLNGTAGDALLGVAAAVEQQSNHPLAQAVVRAAQEKQLALPQAGSLENVPGRGVRSQVEGDPVLIGSLALFEESNGHSVPADLRQTIAKLEADGRSTMAVSRNGQFLGVLGLADSTRPGVRETLQTLRRLGVKRLIMLTGDNPKVAARIAGQVGITEVRAGLLPEDKLEAIRALQQETGGVAMVGDGVNDAPALAAATVGIAMGGAGTAVALETADVALMADDIARLPFAVGLSRASRAIIRQNLAVSLGVIGLLILASVAGVVALSGAVVLHEGSTIVVVLNALRLLRYREPA
jgi:Cd2+/Zn2+-exporting ATPase